MAERLLEVRDLRVTFVGEGRRVEAVRGVDLWIERGECVGLVGASGSGKSVTALALPGLLANTAQVSGEVRFEGRTLWPGDERARRAVRGRGIALIFQEPTAALHPAMRVGAQIEEVLRLHRGLGRREAGRAAVEWLERVGIDRPELRARAHPHELSGGMCQRVTIAMALAGRPKLLVADEATTALDTTVQAQILDLLVRLQREEGTALWWISHDREVVDQVADRVLHMAEGRLVEPAAAGPRTASEPAIGGPAVGLRSQSPVVLAARSLRVEYRRGRSRVRAVRGVDLELREGEALAVVGESGSGKSSLARALLRLEGSEGVLEWSGRSVPARPPRRQRHEVQMVFQEPGQSLDPRRDVAQILDEGILARGSSRGAERRERREALLLEVGLTADVLGRFPHQLSGGQKQRVAIARALAVEPKVLVCDEPVAALDADSRDRVLDLLGALRRSRGLAVVIVTHDLSVVEHRCDRCIVLYAGKVQEEARVPELFADPRHPYTRALLEARPTGRRGAPWRAPEGEPPSPIDPPPGCAFEPRCALRETRCGSEVPWTVLESQGHRRGLRCVHTAGSASAPGSADGVSR